MRFANPRLTLEQLKALFENSGNRLGAGRQGVVAASDDGLLAVKRQPLQVSDQERRHGVTPDTAAYMTARVGQEGLGPRLVQYEIDPVEGMAYLAMENLGPQGYKAMSSLSEQEYRNVYARQMLLEAKAARAGIGLQDTHGDNVMVNPATGGMMFLDQGFAKPLDTPNARSRSRFVKASSGLQNLEEYDLVAELQDRMKAALLARDDQALEAVAEQAVLALRSKTAS